MKILFADDNPVDRLIAKKFATKMNWDFEFVEDGNSALSSVLKEKYDLVFLDIHMPNKSGQEVLDEIRNQGDQYLSQLPVFGLTASHPSTFEQLKKEGFTEILAKPLKLHDLQKINLDSKQEKLEKNIEEKFDSLCGDDPEFRTNLANSFSDLLTEIEQTIKQALIQKDSKLARSMRHKALSTIKILELDELLELISTAIDYLEGRDERLPANFLPQLDSHIYPLIHKMNMIAHENAT